MEDRELLELAAKAALRAGLKLECPDDPDGVYIARSVGRVWNPITDDGDALRLAVQLGLDIQFMRGFSEVWVEDYEGSFPTVLEELVDNKAISVKRAIVRAAAEIGRSMP